MRAPPALTSRPTAEPTPCHEARSISRVLPRLLAAIKQKPHNATSTAHRHVMLPSPMAQRVQVGSFSTKARADFPDCRDDPAHARSEAFRLHQACERRARISPAHKLKRETQRHRHQAQRARKEGRTSRSLQILGLQNLAATERSLDPQSHTASPECTPTRHVALPRALGPD